MQRSPQEASLHDLQYQPQDEYISESYHIKQTHTDSSPQYKQCPKTKDSFQ